MAYKKSNANGQATMANSEPVVIASDQSAVPVSGTVTANIGTVATLATSAKQDTGNTSVASIDTKTPALGQALAAASVPVVLTAAQITTLTPPAAITGFATETTLGSLLTSSQLIDDTVFVDDTATHATGTTKGLGIMAVAAPTDASVDANDIGMVAMTTARALKNDLTTIAGTAAVSGSGNATGALRVELANNGIGVLATVGAVTAITNALPAGTNAIGKLAANSGVDIGDVDILSIAAGDNNIGNVDVVTLPATPAGTNAIGKLLPPDVDVTAHTNYARKYYTSAGAATDGIVWSPAAGKRWHVVGLYFQVSAACTVTFEDDKAGGDDPVLKGEYPANGGAFLTFPEKYPMASGEDAADLLVTTSAGNIYVTCVGYEI